MERTCGDRMVRMQGHARPQSMHDASSSCGCSRLSRSMQTRKSGRGNRAIVLSGGLFHPVPWAPGLMPARVMLPRNVPRASTRCLPRASSSPSPSPSPSPPQVQAAGFVRGRCAPFGRLPSSAMLIQAAGSFHPHPPSHQVFLATPPDENAFCCAHRSRPPYPPDRS